MNPSDQRYPRSIWQERSINLPGHFLFPALQTHPRMDANDPTAMRARPAGLFLPQESLQPNGLDRFQVFDLTHGVFGAIALIQLFQTRTRKRVAFKTKAGLAFFETVAMFDAAIDAMRRFIPVVRIATGTGFVLAQVRAANPAVHAAWGDKRRLDDQFAIHGEY